jgi:hypothetical protein
VLRHDSNILESFLQTEPNILGEINGYHDILGEIPPGPIKLDKISMKTASATGNRGGDHRGFTRAAAKKRFS